MSRYAETVSEIRKFNRFYTVSMGFLDSGYLDTVYSIVETRILFEIRMRGTCIQSDIAKTLHVDKSYLSRIITRFSKNGIIEKYKLVLSQPVRLYMRRGGITLQSQHCQ